MNFESPLDAIEKLYTNSHSDEMRRACLCYCLHYQHYNAEFTERENIRLGYPFPLCASTNKAAYIRTDYHPLFEIIYPWVQINLIQRFEETKNKFKDKKETFDYFKLTSLTLLDLFELFYKNKSFLILNETDIQESVCIRKIENKYTLLVKIEINNLQESLHENLQTQFKKNNLNQIREEYPNLFIIFYLNEADVDCSIMWVAKWQNPNINNELKCVKLFELFTNENLSLWSKAGAIPDRLAVNKFANFNIEENELFKTLSHHSNLKKYESSSNSNSNGRWLNKIKEIELYSFIDDPGSKLYQQAILKWNSVLLNQYPIFHALLASQVIPWISDKADIVNWAKGYQNLCEIVMLCLQSFPDLSKMHDLERLQSIILNEMPTDIYKSIGLFPYAMNSVIFTLGHILKNSNGKTLNVTCISHNYFETNGLLKNMHEKGLIRANEKNSLEEIDEIPDVLISDIHSNNAAAKEIYQNDIGNWIATRLSDNKNQKMILILDITLNYLTDPIFLKIIKTLNIFIEEEKLEVYGILSVAKLLQLGADNFSGGLCLYLGKKNGGNPPIFPSPIPEKVAFFTLLTENFQHITASYFKQIRENTDWIYKELNKEFLDISNSVSHQIIAENYEINKTHFCATKVKQNTDDHTVYIALSFEPFFVVLEKYKLQKIKELLKSIYNESNLQLEREDTYSLKSILIKIKEKQEFEKQIQKDIKGLANLSKIKLKKISGENETYDENTIILKLQMKCVNNKWVFEGEKYQFPSLSTIKNPQFFKKLEELNKQYGNNSDLKNLLAIIRSNQIEANFFRNLFIELALLLGVELKKHQQHNESLEKIFNKIEEVIKGSQELLADNFSPEGIYENIKIKEREKYVSKLRRMLLKLAEIRGFPLTGRQSFGFSLSNMSGVCESIRFSIGVENQTLRQLYIDLVSEFSYALTRSIAHEPSQFYLESFEKQIKNIYEIINGIKDFEPKNIPFLEDSYDQYGKHSLINAGMAEVSYDCYKLYLMLTQNKKEVCIGFSNIIFGENETYTHSDLLKLFFHLQYLKSQSIYVKNYEPLSYKSNLECYKIFDDFNDFPLVDNCTHSINVAGQGFNIRFNPEFLLIIDNVKYTLNEVYVIEESRTKPTQLARLDKEKRNFIFNQCVKYNLTAKLFKTNGILLSFLDEKPSIDYFLKLEFTYLENGIRGIVNFLNELNLNMLPLPKNCSWDNNRNALTVLFSALKSFGPRFLYKLTPDQMDLIGTINKILIKSTLKEMFVILLNDSLNHEKQISRDSAEAFAKIFIEHCDDEYIVELKNWIINAEKNEINEDRFSNYLRAIFPIVKFLFTEIDKFYTMKISASLHTISYKKRADFPEFFEYTMQLMDNFFVKAQKVTKADFILKLLDFYVYYPFNLEMTDQIYGLIRNIDTNLCIEWIKSSNFFYEPIDHLVYQLSILPDFIPIFYEHHQEKIKIFLERSGFKKLILEMNIKNQEVFIASVRWAIITQDEQLFKMILDAREKNLFGQVIPEINCYKQFLNCESPIQAQLLKKLEY
ncbi:MAG: hypothetical protein H0V82_12520 [Candidatus Protochlamydia sp.]|nr:hypothetical protein [Candidatus Protochlamydia sp.]